MSKLIFINLPVTDLPRATAFYESVGAAKNPDFSNDVASCMVLSETIHVMLLTHPFFNQFTTKKIATPDTCEVLICVSAESRQGVDEMVEAAAKAGGRADPNPTQDHGSMYGRSFEDPDGHIWEVMWMDVAAHLAGADNAGAPETTPELA